jgi:hypothetical protein
MQGTFCDRIANILVSVSARDGKQEAEEEWTNNAVPKEL